MSEQQKFSPRPLADDEKSIPIMLYTSNALYWGNTIIKEKVRVSTWLRTQSAPDNVSLYNARVIIPASGTSPKPMAFSEIHIPTSQINAIHQIPPSQDPIDYDPQDQNSHLYPITAFVGIFRMDGNLYLSVHSNLLRYIEIYHETFTSLYNVEITCPHMPALATMRVPFVLLRRSAAIFALKPS